MLKRCLSFYLAIGLLLGMAPTIASACYIDFHSTGSEGNNGIGHWKSKVDFGFDVDLTSKPFWMLSGGDIGYLSDGSKNWEDWFSAWGEKTAARSGWGNTKVTDGAASVGGNTSVAELDAGSSASALALLFGRVLILNGRCRLSL